MAVTRQSLDDQQTTRDVARKNYDISIEMLKKLIADREKARIPQTMEQVAEAWREFKSAEIGLMLCLKREGRQEDADTHQTEIVSLQVDFDRTTATAKRVTIEGQGIKPEERKSVCFPFLQLQFLSQQLGLELRLRLVASPLRDSPM